jgi:hypothetical protein
MSFNINNVEVVELTNKLEKLHRSAMPIAVRSTLNDAAFLARRLIIKNFRSNFIIRNRTFITSHASANKCQNTFSINQMQSEAGIIKGKTKSGDLLEKQEFGGGIDRKSIPTDNVRLGKSNRKLVINTLYIKKFLKRPNGTIYKSGESTIFKSNKGIYRIFRGGKIEQLYVFNRSITIQRDPFVEPSEKETSTKIESLFEKNANKQFEKYLRK